MNSKQIYICIYEKQTEYVERRNRETRNSKNGHLTNNCRKTPLCFLDCRWWVHVLKQQDMLLCPIIWSHYVWWSHVPPSELAGTEWIRSVGRKKGKESVRSHLKSSNQVSEWYSTSPPVIRHETLIWNYSEACENWHWRECHYEKPGDHSKWSNQTLYTSIPRKLFGCGWEGVQKQISKHENELEPKCFSTLKDEEPKNQNISEQVHYTFWLKLAFIL